LRGAPEAHERRRRIVAASGILAVVGFLAVFKYHFIQELLWVRGEDPAARAAGYVFLAGVSYFSFKAIHGIVESYKRSLTGLDALTWLNYLTFFPAFVSGPINRYNHFAAQLGAEKRGPLAPDMKAGAERIIHGLFKKFVLVQLVAPYTIVAKPLAGQSGGEVVLGLYAYALFSYFDFSGYSDLAIGGARLMGLELPENFNWPFLQKNIRELWTNWHMSLTSWLVDYIYWPIVRKLRNVDYLRPRPVLLSVIGMIVTFLVCGAWHGESLNFILWGAYHGAGISILMVYQRQKKKIRVKSVQRYFVSRTSRVVGAVGAFHYFTFGMALFALDMEKLRVLLSNFVR